MFAGPPADLSSVDNLRGSRPPEGQRSRPFKAMQGVQVEEKDAAETLNPKHSESVLHKSEIVCVRAYLPTTPHHIIYHILSGSPKRMH